ncbi:MAG: outer membrane beta-barrel protein [Ginsengibacter sp.]
MHSLKNFFSVNVGQNISFYHSRQKGEIRNEFKNSTKATNLSASMNITKKFSLSSNVKYTNSSSAGSKSIDFTIWNADATYRFLKGNNAEIKFSALDLLHQNVSIISYGSNNQVTYGTQNILQQYFMIKLSYFPRKFGKKEKSR